MKTMIKFLSPKQLSELSGIPIQTIYYLIRTHALPHYRIGKKLLISDVDFFAFLELHREESKRGP